MGLDNGICVKKNALTQLTNLEERFSTPSGTDSFIDITYWRKCCGIRDDIIRYLCNKYDVSENDIGAFELDTNDINKEMGTTIVMATHDKEIVNKMKKRVIRIENGLVETDKMKGSYKTNESI